MRSTGSRGCERPRVTVDARSSPGTRIAPLLGWTDGNRFVAGLERARDGHDFAVRSRPQAVGVWSLVIATYDGAHVRVYVDGVLDGCQRIGRQVAYTGAAPLRIGSIKHTNHGNRGRFDGRIDEVRIYDRALGADEVADLFTHNRGVRPAGVPVACD